VAAEDHFWRDGLDSPSWPSDRIILLIIPTTSTGGINDGPSFLTAVSIKHHGIIYAVPLITFSSLMAPLRRQMDDHTSASYLDIPATYSTNMAQKLVLILIILHFSILVEAQVFLPS
jgi:hypothetical protein